MEELLKRLHKVLEDIGVYDVNLSKELEIRDIIQDSLTYISFFVEIEKEFNVEIPDSAYTEDIGSFTLSELLEKVLIPLGIN
ncbi:MAG: hypothetical protein HFG37_06205 [Eubacterium sp.]|nr:hypothetical protein [Eubacterium sp.]